MKWRYLQVGLEFSQKKSNFVKNLTKVKTRQLNASKINNINTYISVF
jgi:hypothetical protein